jgi:hypothetical protein
LIGFYPYRQLLKGWKVITSNLKQVREAVTKYAGSVAKGAENARDEMMVTLIQLSKEEIKGRRPVGQKATAGAPPMNRTGNLRRSIRGEKRQTGFAKYEAIVGPTIIYGRAVELGGEFSPNSWRGTSAVKGFPYMRPAFQKFRLIAPRIVKKHLSVGNR